MVREHTSIVCWDFTMFTDKLQYECSIHHNAKMYLIWIRAMIWSQYRFRIILPASVKYILLDCDEQNDMGLELISKIFYF